MSQHHGRYVFVSSLLLVICLIAAPAQAQRVHDTSISEHLTQVDAYTFKSDRHLVQDIPAEAGGGLVNVVVEIPAGTNAKWQVDPKDGLLKWDFAEGKPRVVDFLPYPGNYGMVPRTSQTKQLGGDGDPLDVLVLGPAVRRGEIVKARVIGVLKFLDAGERDDKILAVLPGSVLGKVRDLKSLQQQYKGALDIVKLWLSNYKGPGVMDFRGVGEVDEAQRILKFAMDQYK